MKIAIHRVNTIAGLREIPREFGAEIDIRSDGSTLYLHHDPYVPGDRLADYLDEYAHGLLILNIKEAGIEADVLREVRSRSIPEFFLLDVEFPYLFKAVKTGEHAVAVRFSEYESIDTMKQFAGKFDWVWIDTVSKLPIDAAAIAPLSRFRSCLVCPERWGRPEDISRYREKLGKLGFSPDAVMTSLRYAPQWMFAARSDA